MYIYVDAENFILRYGTHVIVSAKFGGEFKIMNTQSKSKSTSIDKFAERCNQEAMSMFSRSYRTKINLVLFNQETSFSQSATTKSSMNNQTDTEQTRM